MYTSISYSLERRLSQIIFSINFELILHAIYDNVLFLFAFLHDFDKLEIKFYNQIYI